MMVLLIAKDTVTTDEEHDVVDADDDAERADSAVRLNTVVHDDVPVLARQDLQRTCSASHAVKRCTERCAAIANQTQNVNLSAM